MWPVATTCPVGVGLPPWQSGRAGGLAPEQLGKGRALAEILAEMTQIAEGIKTAPVAMALASRFDVEMPIAAEIAGIVDGSISPDDAYGGCCARSSRLRGRARLTSGHQLNATVSPPSPWAEADQAADRDRGHAVAGLHVELLELLRGNRLTTDGPADGIWQRRGGWRRRRCDPWRSPPAGRGMLGTPETASALPCRPAPDSCARTSLPRGVSAYCARAGRDTRPAFPMCVRAHATRFV